MKQNKQHGSKSTNCNLQTRPFEPAEQSMCFLRRSLEWMTEAKNINDSYNFDLRSHVSEKQGNRSKENAGRWQNKKYSLCQRNNVLWVLYAKFGKMSGVSKHFAFPNNLCYQFRVSSKLLVFFYKLPTTNFLRMYCYSPVIGLVNFVKLAPVTVVTVSCLQWKTTSNTYHFCDIAHILLTWKGHKPITVK